MRALLRKGRWVPCKYRCLRIQLLHAIGMEKALHQPAAKEACATSEKNPLATHLRPKLARMRKNMVEIGCRKRCSQYGFSGE